MVRNLIWILAVAIFLTGCQTKIYIPKVAAINSQGPWLNGRQLQMDTLKGIVALAQFEYHTEEALVFSIGFTNNTEKQVLIDPSRFSSQGTEYNGSINDSIRYGFVKPAMDPEKLLERLDDNINVQKADYNRSAAISSFGAFVNLLEGLNTRETAEERNARLARNTSQYTSQQVSQLDAKLNIQQAQQAALNLQKVLLRKTTLFPGQSVGGLVFFHRHNKCSKFSIRMPVGNIPFELKYSHKLLTKTY